MPRISLSPYNSVRKDTSSAVATGFRKAAGRMPIPTVIRLVEASTAVAWAIPPRKKQSSASHNSSKPKRSDVCANVRKSSIAISLGSSTPSLFALCTGHSRRGTRTDPDRAEHFEGGGVSMPVER